MKNLHVVQDLARANPQLLNYAWKHKVFKTWVLSPDLPPLEVGTGELTLKMVATQEVANERSEIKIDLQFDPLFFCYGKSNLVTYGETKAGNFF